MKQGSLKIRSCINSNIKKGDKVRLIDGSGLTRVGYNDEFFIIYSYPKVTGIDLNLSAISATVIEDGIIDIGVSGYSSFYIQDIVIKIGKSRFRTASKFVELI